MKEQLISFDTAKLTKEKGFDEPVYAIYSGNQLGIFTENDTIFNKWNHCRDATYSAPTQSLLQKWLREVHNLRVYVYEHIRFKGDLNEHICFKCEINLKFTDFYKGTYEEALEVGLQEALKLI